MNIFDAKLQKNDHFQMEEWKEMLTYRREASKHPDKVQPSLEAFGFDMVKTAKNVLVLEIKWSKGLLIPEYLTLVCGIFSIHKARWKNMPIQPISFRTWH